MNPLWKTRSRLHTQEQAGGRPKEVSSTTGSWMLPLGGGHGAVLWALHAAATENDLSRHLCVTSLAGQGERTPPPASNFLRVEL